MMVVPPVAAQDAPAATDPREHRSLSFFFFGLLSIVDDPYPLEMAAKGEANFVSVGGISRK
jgi:hypothetical protein